MFFVWRDYYVSVACPEGKYYELRSLHHRSGDITNYKLRIILTPLPMKDYLKDWGRE